MRSHNSSIPCKLNPCSSVMKNFTIDKSHWKPFRFGDVVTEPKKSVKNLEESSTLVQRDRARSAYVS